MKKAWEKLNLKWRLTHPIEGIVKPLVRELWRQAGRAVLHLWWGIGHLAGAARNLHEVVISWPGMVILMTLGLWGAFAEAYLGLFFFKFLLIYAIVDIVSWTIAQAPEAWKEKPYVR